MKTITVVLLMFAAHATFAQVKVNEIKLKFGSEFHKAKDADVIYPIVSTGNKEIDDRINFTVIKNVTAEDSVPDISRTLFHAMTGGLSELDYKITFNTKDIFSLRLDALSCRAYCSVFSIYLNFNLHTGDLLKIEDVIKDDDFDTFRTAVLNDKIKALKRDKKEKDSLLAAEKIDSSDYNFMIKKIQECSSVINFEKFLLFENELQVIDDCEFPHVMAGMQPVYKLKFLYKKIKRYLHPALREKLKSISP